MHFNKRKPKNPWKKISKKKDYDDTARKGMNLLLKLTGHTSDYDISYDAKALKEKITKDFTDEGQEWRKIIRGDSSKRSETPELEDEYFDFEEAESDSVKKN